jgi:hypothetical protein
MAGTAPLMSRKLLPMRPNIIWRFLALSLFCSHLWAANAEVPCTDIRKIDFKNSTIDVGNAVFEFKNGEASLFDNMEPKTLEWEATLREYATIEVAPAVSVRFFRIYSNHINGSGARFYLVGYGCFQGKTKQVFKREGVSLVIDRIDAQAVVVALHTVYGSPTTKYFSYMWNDKVSKYELNSTWDKK